MRLLLGDDHPIFSAVLGELFADAGHTVVERGLPVVTALARCGEAGVDVCVVGLDTTPLSVLEAPTGTRRSALVLMTSLRNRALLGRAMLLSVSAIALRDDDFADVLQLVTESARRAGRTGRPAMSPCARAAVGERTARPGARALTRREEQILRRLAAGESAASVARSMDVRVTTVRSHVASVFQKLGAHTMVEAVAIARRAGLLEGRVLEVRSGPVGAQRVPYRMGAAR